MNPTEIYENLKEVLWRLDHNEIGAAKRLLEEVIKSPWINEDYV